MKTAAFLILLLPARVFSWHDNTHMAIAKAAGIERYYTAVGADIIKIKLDNEKFNHWYNANRNEPLTSRLVKSQIKKYNTGNDPDGHVLGAIVASFNEYLEANTQGKYNAYYLGLTAHYIGDLSNPMHLSVHDDFNKQRHSTNDGIIDGEVLNNIKTIKTNKIIINSENDFIREIIKIAESSRKLGYKMRDENRDMTKEEAYRQVSMSASLLKAVIEYAKTNTWK